MTSSINEFDPQCMWYVSADGAGDQDTLNEAVVELNVEQSAGAGGADENTTR